MFIEPENESESDFDPESDDSDFGSSRKSKNKNNTKPEPKTKSPLVKTTSKKVKKDSSSPAKAPLLSRPKSSVHSINKSTKHTDVNATNTPTNKVNSVHKQSRF